MVARAVFVLVALTLPAVALGQNVAEVQVAARKGQAAVQVVGSPAPSGGQQASGQQGREPSAPTAAGGGAAAPDAFAGQPPGTGPASVLRIEPPTVYLLPSENTRVSPRALKEDR